MKKKYWLLLSTVFAIMLVLAACGDDEETSSTEKPVEEENTTTEETTTDDGGSTTAEAPTLPEEVTNDGDVIAGGTFKYALVTNSPFQGILLQELYDDGYDGDILEIMSNGIFADDGDFLITDDGIAKLDVDTENSKATITIQHDVKWSDGEPLTADDIIYSYEIIGHPDYTGIRYDADFQNIIGAEEYKAGTADSISGIKQNQQ